MRARLSFLALALAMLTLPARDSEAQYRDQFRGRYSDQYRDRYNERGRGDYNNQYRDEDTRGGRNVAGEFDYYALVLSWSPSHCAESRGEGDELQCNRGDGRRFNFVLHGLWPQYDKGWPQDCRTPRRPFVPQPLIDQMLDIMPSPSLVIHEYRKHGTCSGLAPDAYFGLARRLFSSIQIPDAYKNPMESQFVEPSRLAADLLRANPKLKPDNLAIACGGPGSRLKEVHICFSKTGEPAACGGNEDQRRMCSASKMFVPPVRSTARDETFGQAPRSKIVPPPNSPLPAPRIDNYDRGS